MVVAKWVRTKPVLWFCVLTFAITWGAWWPMAAYNLGLVDVELPGLYFIGGLGPGIAAYIVMVAVRGPAAASELLGPLLRWRVGWVWFTIALFLWPGIWALSAALGGKWTAELAALGSLSQSALAFGVYLLAAVPEEVGWRGFLLPSLQARFSALTSSVIVGVVWFVWHLPLLLGGSPIMSTYPLLPLALWMIAESVLYTWLYNNTRGSLLIAVLVHALSNVLGVFSATPWTTTGITIGAALIVIAIYGARDLSRAGPRVTHP